MLRGGIWLAVGLSARRARRLQRRTTPEPNGKAPYPLARPDEPVTLPIKDSNPPIEDGLEPETGGAFKILNYDDYMAPGVMKDFGEKYGVEVAGHALQQLRRDAGEDPRARVSRSTSSSRVPACSARWSSPT